MLDLEESLIEWACTTKKEKRNTILGKTFQMCRESHEMEAALSISQRKVLLFESSVKRIYQANFVQMNMQPPRRDGGMSVYESQRKKIVSAFELSAGNNVKMAELLKDLKASRGVVIIPAAPKESLCYVSGKLLLSGSSCIMAILGERGGVSELYTISGVVLDVLEAYFVAHHQYKIIHQALYGVCRPLMDAMGEEDTFEAFRALVKDRLKRTNTMLSLVNVVEKAYALLRSYRN